MIDPWNPTPNEIRTWAYAPDAVEPCQDWDLALSWSLHEKVLLETASDEACPNRRYLLRVLYLIVGDAIRTDFHTRQRSIIEGLVARGDEYGHPDIRTWQQRSRELLASPALFNYDLWCGGGYAHENL